MFLTVVLSSLSPPCKERGSARSAMGAIRLPLYVIVWVRLFTRNTQRDVPYGCSFLVSHNGNVITFESYDSTTRPCRVGYHPPLPLAMVLPPFLFEKKRNRLSQIFNFLLPREALQSAKPLNLPLPISNLPFCEATDDR